MSQLGPTVVVINNILDPHASLEAYRGHAGHSLAQLKPKTDAPCICKLNGDFVLPDDMSWVPCDEDHVQFSVLLQGNQNSMAVAGIVLIVIGAIYSNPNLIAAGVGLLAPALIQTPATSVLTQSQQASPSPTYSIQLSGNSARLGQPIPDLFGKHILLPDFASQPYSEYDANGDQFYHALLSLGTFSKFTVHSVMIDDTDISHFEDVSLQYVGPNFVPPLSLVEAGVVNSPEVAANDLKFGKYVGPFAVCGPGLKCSYIAYDIAAPKGLFEAATDGSFSSKTASWFVEVRAINDQGAATGTWKLLSSASLSGATNKPIRKSYKVAVTPGRYEVRVSRTNTEDENNRTAHGLQWIGLRAHLLISTPLPSNVSFLAVKIRATSQLSGISERRISLILTRWLPHWTAVGGWAAEAESTSIAWAIAAILKRVGVPDSRIDLLTLEELNNVWTARLDSFNGVFDKRITVWQALTTVARAGRARPIMRGNVFTFVRDELQTLPVALYNMRNIVRGSFRFNHILPDDDEGDSVELEYFDASTWSAQNVLVPIPGSTLTNFPSRTSILGITNRNQAMREALAVAANLAYRRSSFTFSTELEGHLPGYGSLIAVAHDLLATTGNGDILDWDGSSARCSEELTWTAGIHYAILTDEFGDVFGPYKVTAHYDSHRMLFVDLPPVGLISTNTERELTRYAMGEGSSYAKNCRVLSVTPEADSTVIQITAIVEDNRVHSADFPYLNSSAGGIIPVPVGRARYGKYAPSGLSNYAAASDAQRNRYGYFSNSSYMMSNGDGAYQYDT